MRVIRSAARPATDRTLMKGNSLLKAATMSGWVISCPPYNATCPSFLAASTTRCHSSFHLIGSAADAADEIMIKTVSTTAHFSPRGRFWIFDFRLPNKHLELELEYRSVPSDLQSKIQNRKSKIISSSAPTLL